MFDVGFSELLVIAVAILIAVGPEDLPDLLFRFGRLVRQVKMFLGGVRDQYSDIMHEAEVQHYRREHQVRLLEEQKKETPPEPVDVSTAEPEQQAAPAEGTKDV